MSLRDLANAVANAGAEAPVDSTSTEFIDGVPAFFGDDDGPLIVCLTFRVGQADETLRHRGLTRLVYELARSAVPASPPDAELERHDGVHQLTTTFTVSGTDDEDTVARFNELVRNLVMLPFDALEATRATMLANPHHRPELLAELQTIRFGLRGYGLLTGDELGLFDADTNLVDDWRRRWFTRGNAVVSFSKKPPGGLSLSPLPDGTRKSLPEPHPIDQPLPGWFPSDDQRIVASFLVADNAAAWLSTNLLEDRLTERLVDTDHLATRVSAHGAQLGGGRMLMEFVIDLAGPDAEAARAATAAELFRFAVISPDDEEIGAARAERRRYALMRHAATLRVAHDHALRDLFDTPAYQSDDITIDMRPDDHARVVRAMLPTGIWLLPRSRPPADRRLLPISEGSTHRVSGNTFVPIDGLVAARRGDRLEVADEGVTLTTSEGTSATVRFADCVAMQVWPDGARTLWGDDGIRVLVHYGVWQGGEQVLGFIDAKVDPWVALVMPTPSGYVIPLAPTAPDQRRR